MTRLFQLDLPNAVPSIAVARAAALAAADELGLAEAKRGRLELAIEEMVVNAVHHAYPPGQAGAIRLTAAIEGAMLAFSVQDWGLPFDPAEQSYSPEAPGERGLGLFLAWRACDEASFSNLKRDGKRFDLRFRLPAPPPPAAEEIAAAAVEKAPALEVRLFRREDAAGIARCAWLAYGYTKPDDHLYHPEELAHRNGCGLMTSLVAVDGSGVVYGHACLDYSHNARVPEYTDLVIAPAARGNPALLSKMLTLGFDTAAAGGARGILALAVTAHTVSQRGALRFGGVPINVHLACVSTDWEVRPGLKPAGRQSEIALYVPVRPGEARTLHVPPRHRAVVEPIFAALREPVTYAGPGPLDLGEGATQFEIESGYLAWGHVAVTVVAYGTDTVAMLAGFLRRFCLDGAATVLLMLPLRDPATAAMGEAFETLGFSVSGVFPHAVEDGGDMLVYQYLNNVAIDPDGERVAPACKTLHDYVVAERRRIDLEVFHALPAVAESR